MQLAGPTLDADADHGAPSDVGGLTLRQLLVGGAVVGAGCAAVLLTDPTDTGVPICASQALFGVDCPLCGGLRCTNALLRGDVLAAADHNVVTAVLLPIIAVWWVVAVLRRARGHAAPRMHVPSWALGAIGVLLLVFTIVRNVAGTGWWSWLASTSY